MDGTPELLATAEELYGLLPEEFTAAREERVRALRREGARERAAAVKALRRPSVAAWLVNAMVRHRGDEVDRLLRLGEALREAQTTLDAGQLRELGRQRQVVVAAIGREARSLARELGRPVTDQIADEVEETLRAGLFDPAAADAVRSGRLTTSLKYAGFGEVDLRDAVALPASPPGRAPARTARRDGRGASERGGPGEAGAAGWDDDREALREAERVVREAERAVREALDDVRRTEVARRGAEQHRDGLRRRARTARERLDSANARVAELESVLASARESAGEASAVWSGLQAEEHTATDRAEAAAADERAARASLDRARAGLARAKDAGPARGQDTGRGRGQDGGRGRGQDTGRGRGQDGGRGRGQDTGRGRVQDVG